jgi:hypothetical protein
MNLRITGTAYAEITLLFDCVYKLICIMKMLLIRENEVLWNISAKSKDIFNIILLKLIYYT